MKRPASCGTVVDKGLPVKQIYVFRKQRPIDYNGLSHTTWKKLRPTGRWRLERVLADNGTILDTTLFIEHKGLIFKEWVHEQDISLSTEHRPEIVEFKCGTRKRGV